MLEMINTAARALHGHVHRSLGGTEQGLHVRRRHFVFPGPLVVNDGERREEEVWDYVRHAKIVWLWPPGRMRFDNDVSKILNYLRGGLPVLSEEPIINTT